jgi:hypothetical protein
MKQNYRSFLIENPRIMVKQRCLLVTVEMEHRSVRIWSWTAGCARRLFNDLRKGAEENPQDFNESYFADQLHCTSCRSDPRNGGTCRGIKPNERCRHFLSDRKPHLVRT